jgi:signal transduction histidine kinase
MVSFKAKLGVVVVGTVVVAVGLIVLSGLVGVQMRYSLPVGAVVAVGFVQLLGHGITAPLREMAAAARAMARGDYSRRVRAEGRDEVGELARAFNTMSADLAAVDEQRKHLVATVSHELRTPISALQALLENIVDGVTAADEATLRTALTQTQRLGRLVTQLLDLSRLESGAVPLTRTRVDVRSFLADVVAQSAVGRESTPVVVSVTPSGAYAEIDADRLHQVFANLLDNAARHSSVDAAVHISATVTAAALCVVVTDDGPGIAAPDRDRVFDAYTRLSPTARDGGGTGLGLAIARWIVGLHGGTISILDTPTGCSVAVELPHPTQEHS